MILVALRYPILQINVILMCLKEINNFVKRKAFIKRIIIYISQVLKIFSDFSLKHPPLRSGYVAGQIGFENCLHCEVKII